ncbi:MAG: HAMP domain-containing protein [Deltaproteobacteria bacterium]|nr:MAG: HAMP domain-containing protein [Deltaproteobacteria bacterium]
MKSIGTRIAAWYATAATATLACLFVVGYLLLERQLVHGLDLLVETEFREVDSRLGADYRTLSPQAIESRIREITDYASTLFYIDIHVPGKGVIFRSTNLIGHDIPDIPRVRNYTAEIPGIGEVRAEEFHKMPFEVTIATPLRPIRDVMDGYIKISVLLLAAMVVVSLFIGQGLARFVLWPVRLIRDTAKRIGHDNLSERIPVPDVHDEIADLARLLNEMFDRLETSFHQVRRFTSEASHELKIPLSLISLHAEKMLVDGRLPPAQREQLQVQLEEVARLNQIIDELLFLSRADARALKLDLRPQSPTALLQAFAQDATVLVEHHDRRFVFEHRGEGSVALDPKWMRQVLLNLVTNAIHVSPRDGLITLRSQIDDGAWRVSVEDEGPGVPADQRDRMFERFVRLATPGKDYPGSGLGLAICRSIVTLHGGKISAAPGTGGRGLRVTTEIPAEETPVLRAVS